MPVWESVSLTKGQCVCVCWFERVTDSMGMGVHLRERVCVVRNWCQRAVTGR